jgi:hypothetical protein
LCGLIGSKLLGPFFYDGTLNIRQYYNFLSNELPMMLDGISIALRENIIFQHDEEITAATNKEFMTR